MSDNIKARIEAVLGNYHEPYLDTDLASARVVRSLEVDGRTAKLEIDLGFACGDYGQQLAEAIRGRIEELNEIDRADVTVGYTIAPRQVQNQLKRLDNISNIIAVASAKGGVGKSTVAANLALAMAADGASVGLLDADIYGPSQPRMMGVADRAKAQNNETIIPNVAHGLQTMSIGYLIDQDSPAILRGPMVTSALQQMLFQTAWDGLDTLIIDLPPGTGDIQLTLSQKVPVSGAVIVTTPQDLSLIDARKGIEMFNKVSVPVLGVIENMSTHVCSNCGHEESIFGAGGGQQLAEQYDVDLIAQLPLDVSIRENADAGQPSVAADPSDRASQAYFQAARRTGARLAQQKKDYAGKFPDIKVEDS
ncbi:iron-sulfur cluster carrier protein ApbC [Salinisphaera sp. USBA-960]|uniref:iron-sulfur cluster carrier protein ApbC n=1 Tax=Salinisphaera orenii TaxID=856731 RepID=UPI000DBE59B3|nr:iron-sulfur cluster carrier protein ApbC [Salifodinibacter halophilus]NNC26630.1 iron-sulfur cluster carrier protein ApbC [Salifodinibacter halophilus]